MVAALAALTGIVVPASASTTTLSADADAFVLAGSPNANKGTVASLRIRNDIKIAYLRFDVPEFPPGETVSRATLRVFASSDSKCGAGAELIRAAADDWGETTITWTNQPGPAGPVLATVAWSSKGFQSFDVTSAVTGAGPMSFMLRHAPGCSATGDATFKSREAQSNRPQLVVETSALPIEPQCSDGLDNDADGLIDFPDDPGCVEALDADETDPPPPPPPGDAKVVAAAGDIVCDPTGSGYAGADPSVCQHRATADLLVGADAVLPLGDLQYADGTLDKFNVAYDPTWGRYAVNTYPAIGNHEYNDPAGGAAGYFGYWSSKGRPTGAGGGYYSFDLGSWHLIALNSSCSQVPCAEGSPQNDFLELDLASTTQPCTLAYWHHPLFNSGAVHGQNAPSGARAFWDDLYAAGVDIVVNGHEHNYQRYAKQDPSGVATPSGIREFVVGTGGRGHYALLEAKDPNFEFGNETDFGVLLLHLADGSYSWEFVNPSGTVLDSGGPVSCN
ncbi:MAG: hypothetical protein A2Z48_05870 [Actinobacteria bacterium RBG_19FT_COMBO_70_19]|nr:MAG: hypothetical protein A2Z48_05870 [Actinobacteria bacterium RBG_19FT_COMBO_70_19]